MAESEAPNHSSSSSSSSSPSFLEVKCKSSGKTRRFAIGTEAGFALSVINRKLISESKSRPESESESESGSEYPLALLIEAFKENEEPIAFGPNSILVNYGDSWVLQTVTALDFSGHGMDGVHPMKNGAPSVPLNESEWLRVRKSKTKGDAISIVYLGKIVFAFLLLFIIGALFTLALENLPNLIAFLHDLNK